MAGDWIPMRMELPDDPAVVSIASDTKISEDAVVGKLLRLWSWANTHTTEGRAPGITARWVDKLVGKAGFGEAMARTGWVVFNAEGVTFPSFERWNQSAKTRLNTNRRVAEHRQKQRESNADSVTDVLPKPLPQNSTKQNRREKTEEPPPPQGVSLPPPVPPDPLNTPAFVAAWTEWVAYRRQRRLSVLQPASVAAQWQRLAVMGHDQAIAAIQHSIANAYQGIFEPKENGHGSRNGTANGTHRPDPAAARRAERAKHEYDEPDLKPPIRR